MKVVRIILIISRTDILNMSFGDIKPWSNTWRHCSMTINTNREGERSMKNTKKKFAHQLAYGMVDRPLETVRAYLADLPFVVHRESLVHLVQDLACPLEDAASCQQRTTSPKLIVFYFLLRANQPCQQTSTKCFHFIWKSGLVLFYNIFTKILVVLHLSQGRIEKSKDE